MLETWQFSPKKQTKKIIYETMHVYFFKGSQLCCLLNLFFATNLTGLDEVCEFENVCFWFAIVCMCVFCATSVKTPRDWWDEAVILSFSGDSDSS